MNKPDSLDEILIRLGYTDFKVLFENFETKDTEELFIYIYSCKDFRNLKAMAKEFS
jgi:ATP-dependent 26S proteasome regulatory subunit